MVTFKNQTERDAYQIAENTRKQHHGFDCSAFGIGALVTEVPQQNLCNCHIFELATKFAEDINKE